MLLVSSAPAVSVYQGMQIFCCYLATRSRFLGNVVWVERECVNGALNCSFLVFLELETAYKQKFLTQMVVVCTLGKKRAPISFLHLLVFVFP